MGVYTSIMTDDMDACYVCGKRADEIHHVMHGPDKKLSEKYGLMVPLCRGCHNKVHHHGGAEGVTTKCTIMAVSLTEY